MLPLLDDSEVFAPKVRAMTLGIIPSGAVAFGPVLEQPRQQASAPAPADPFAPTNLIAGVWSFPVDASASAGGVSVLECRAVVNDTGNGSVEGQLSDGSAPAMDSDVAIQVNGVTALTMLVEERVSQTVASNEEAGQKWRATGRGYLAEWEGLRVYPDVGAEHPERLGPPVPDVRYFNVHASTGVSTDGWGHAVVTDPKYGELNNQRFPLPEGWPDPTALWIWSTDSSGSVAAGVNYFRYVFDGTGFGDCQIAAAGNDAFELWLDGVPILSDDGPFSGQKQAADVWIGDHFHLLSAKVTNRGGRAGFLMAICPYAGDVLATSLVRSAGYWFTSGYTVPPGFTPGEVVRILLAEAHARGTMMGWSLSFDRDTDSTGQPWPVVNTISLPIGIDGLSALKQLAESYFDFVASPTGRVLHAYVKDTTLGSGGAYTPGSNVLDLSVAASTGQGFS